RTEFIPFLIAVRRNGINSVLPFIGGPDRKLRSESRPLSRVRLNGEVSGEEGGALLHAAESAGNAGPQSLARVEAFAAVRDLEHEPTVRAAEAHLGLAYARVAGDVRQGFLQDAIDRRFEVRREAHVQARMLESHVNAGVVGEALDV